MQEFSVYFLSSRLSIQQDMVNSLRSLSTLGSYLEEEKERKAVRCAHYKGQRIRANGKLKCVQRYLCNGGCKNVRETTGKFWFALKKKDKMKTSLYDVLWGDRIRKSGKETGIAMQTSFDCRPKLGTSFSSVAVSEFEGIVAGGALFSQFQKKGILL
jgi:transposase-like protein